MLRTVHNACGMYALVHALANSGVPLRASALSLSFLSFCLSTILRHSLSSVVFPHPLRRAHKIHRRRTPQNALLLLPQQSPLIPLPSGLPPFSNPSVTRLTPSLPPQTPEERSALLEVCPSLATAHKVTALQGQTAVSQSHATHERSLSLFPLPLLYTMYVLMRTKRNETERRHPLSKRR